MPNIWSLIGSCQKGEGEIEVASYRIGGDRKEHKSKLLCRHHAVYMVVLGRVPWGLDSNQVHSQPRQLKLKMSQNKATLQVLHYSVGLKSTHPIEKAHCRGKKNRATARLCVMLELFLNTFPLSPHDGRG